VFKGGYLQILPMGYTIVYDSGCGPCTTFRNVVGFLDASYRMEYVGLVEAEEGRKLSSIPPDLRHRSFHLIADDGSVLSGAQALPALFSQLPCGGLVSAAMKSSPLVSRSAGFVYSTLARLHDRGSCETRNDLFI
jgi:predicted DCC family thiol-disulfide oxidoreductase YuxK